MKKLGTIAEQIVLESLTEMRNDQESPRERLTYIKTIYDDGIATEGVTNNIKGQLVQKLYTDVLSKTNIDFGTIPDSKGNFLDYQYYQLITESIDALNVLMEKKPKEFIELTTLYDNLISLRSDFEYGFKFDIEIIKLTYNVAIMSLFGLLNYCVSVYTNYLREVNGITMKFGKVKKKDLVIVNSVTSLNRLFKSGEWTNIVKSFKGKDSQLLGELLGSVSLFASKGIGAAVSGIASAAAPIAIPVLVVVAIIALLTIIRWLIYYFYELSSKIGVFASTQKEFLDIYMRKTKDSDSAVTKQKAMLNSLESISNSIEAKVFRADANTKREISKSNRDYSMQELTDTNSSVSDLNSDTDAGISFF